MNVGYMAEAISQGLNAISSIVKTIDSGRTERHRITVDMEKFGKEQEERINAREDELKRFCKEQEFRLEEMRNEFEQRTAQLHNESIREEQQHEERMLELKNEDQKDAREHEFRLLEQKNLHEMRMGILSIIRDTIAKADEGVSFFYSAYEQYGAAREILDFTVHNVTEASHRLNEIARTLMLPSGGVRFVD